MFHPITLTILKELGEADTLFNTLREAYPTKCPLGQAKNITFSMGKDACPYPPTISIITFGRHPHKEQVIKGGNIMGLVQENTTIHLFLIGKIQQDDLIMKKRDQ